MSLLKFRRIKSTYHHKCSQLQSKNYYFTSASSRQIRFRPIDASRFEQYNSDYHGETHGDYYSAYYLLAAGTLLIPLSDDNDDGENQDNISLFDAIYEFDMMYNTTKTPMRAYLSTSDNVVHLRFNRIAGSDYGEFPIGLAQFEIPNGQNNKVQLTRTDKGVTIGDENLYVDANYTLLIDESTSNLWMICKYIGSKGETKQQVLTLHPTTEKQAIPDTDKASKCWIPYPDKSKNIQKVIANGKSIWKTGILDGLNVYDLDILNDDDGKSGCGGCWGWTDMKGYIKEAENVGTAYGDNFDYQFKFDGDLMIVQWDDEGTWITEETKECHHGSTLFMIIGEDEAVATFTCMDGINGSQMSMRRQRGADFEKLKCPLTEK